MSAVKHFLGVEPGAVLVSFQLIGPLDEQAKLHAGRVAVDLSVSSPRFPSETLFCIHCGSTTVAIVHSWVRVVPCTTSAYSRNPGTDARSGWWVFLVQAVKNNLH